MALAVVTRRLALSRRLVAAVVDGARPATQISSFSPVLAAVPVEGRGDAWTPPARRAVELESPGVVADHQLPVRGRPVLVVVVLRGPGETQTITPRQEPEALGPLLPLQEHPSTGRVAAAVEAPPAGERPGLAVAVLVVQEPAEAELRVLPILAAAVVGAAPSRVSALAQVLAAAVVL